MTTTSNPTTTALPQKIALDEFAALGRAGLEEKYNIVIVAVRDGVHGLEMEVRRQRPEEDEHATK